MKIDEDTSRPIAGQVPPERPSRLWIYCSSVKQRWAVNNFFGHLRQPAAVEANRVGEQWTRQLFWDVPGMVSMVPLISTPHFAFW